MWLLAKVTALKSPTNAPTYATCTLEETKPSAYGNARENLISFN